MKELRPGSSGSSEIRLIFAFDPRREGSSWSPATSPARGPSGTGSDPAGRRQVHRPPRPAGPGWDRSGRRAGQDTTRKT